MHFPSASRSTWGSQRCRRAAAVVGILFGWLLRKRTFDGRVGRVLASELGFDRVFSNVIPAVAGLQARTVVWADDTLVDSYPRGSAHSALGAGWLMDRLQSAKAQLYATAIAVGVRGARRHCPVGGSMIAAALLAFAVAALVLTIAPAAFAGRRAAELGAVASLVALVELARIPIGKPGSLWAEIDEPWIAAVDARFHVGVDEISWPFALLTAALTLACCIWLWQRETSPALVALLMVIGAASLGVFVAQDLLLFFIFFEFALDPDVVRYRSLGRWRTGE